MSERVHTGPEGVFDAAAFADEACRTHYAREGWVMLRGFYDRERDVAPVRNEIAALIALQAAHLKLSTAPNVAIGASATDGADISRAFLDLCNRDRERGGQVYRATRHLPSLQRLLMKAESLDLARALMNTTALNVIPYVPVRIDVRGEEKYLFSWHQDYPYTQGSTDGIVMWSSLFDLGEGEGGVRLLPGSHRDGLRRVAVVDETNARKNGAHTMIMEGAAACEEAAGIRLHVRAGDVLVFSTLLVHRSIPMVRGDVRWTSQFRYANFADPAAVARGWPGGLIEGNAFEKDHPQFVVASA